LANLRFRGRVIVSKERQVSCRWMPKPIFPSAVILKGFRLSTAMGGRDGWRLAFVDIGCDPSPNTTRYAGIVGDFEPALSNQIITLCKRWDTPIFTNILYITLHNTQY
jgi:hypothetical protein